jgi:hypothetical protein
MRHLSIGTTVVTKERFEVSPLEYLNEGLIGEVIDETFPYYYLVKFDFGAYWIDEIHLVEVI